MEIALSEQTMNMPQHILDALGEQFERCEGLLDGRIIDKHKEHYEKLAGLKGPNR